MLLSIFLFFRVRFHVGLMNCFLQFYSFEWWSFEILILVSGILPNPELHTSVLSIW